MTATLPARPSGSQLAASALLEEVEALRADAYEALDPARRSELGQFMTPASVAEFMGSLLSVEGREVSVLDPGAGLGSLTAAAVSALTGSPKAPRAIAVTAYEVDPALSEPLGHTLRLCKRYCDDLDVQFSGRIVTGDFLASAAKDLSRRSGERFDCVVLNPPYRKIRSGSTERKLLKTIGLEVSNVYAGFLGAAIQLLRPGGQVVSITPRSFANGPYFRSFRKFLLSELTLTRMHVFDSRQHAFKDDGVLQENVVLRGIRSQRESSTVVLSASSTPSSPVRSRVVPWTRVVYESDPEQFVHLILDDEGDVVAERMARLGRYLHDLGLSVSTGPVVDFRVSSRLRPAPEPGTVPLIYPAHFSRGTIRWPQPESSKPNALAINGCPSGLTVPDGTYVLVRRFSAKEERRRIVAAVYEERQGPGGAVAFENHLNYFHQRGSGLSRALARGLAIYLNSSLVDTHFRQFSGHTQVNASDLRNIPYPPLNRLEEAGAATAEPVLSQDEIDTITNDVLVPLQ